MGSAPNDCARRYATDHDELAHPPALPGDTIDLPRLTRQLTRPIVLITAPSGYGKTTLLNQWQDMLGAAWSGVVGQ
jgi:ATP/maltotriose-dependent transcriptional regulator MalT